MSETLDTSLTGLQTDVAALVAQSATNKAILLDLDAKLASLEGGATPGQLATIASIRATLQGVTTSMASDDTAADPGFTPPAPAPTEPEPAPVEPPPAA